MKWYLAVVQFEEIDILEFENEEDLTLSIWQLQEGCPEVYMQVYHGAEDK